MDSLSLSLSLLISVAKIEGPPILFITSGFGM
jgi:hypothetical protein